MKSKVFLVDDSMIARTMLKNMLGEVKQVEVVGEAGTGQGAIIMFDETNPDIVVIEVEMSGGMETSEVIREIKRINPDVRIVISAGMRHKKDVISIVPVGFDDFISKPYNKEQVISCFESLAGVLNVG